MPPPSAKAATPPAHSSSYILPVAIFLFGIVLAIAVTFNALIFFQERKGAELDAQIQENEQKTAAVLTADVQQYLDAKAAVKGIDPNRIPFSRILEHLIAQLEDMNTNLSLSVAVSSLAIDTQNKLTINLVTSDYPSVAAVASAIRRDSLFSSAFIPNASTSTSQDRRSVVNFPIVMELNLNASTATAQPRRVPAATTPPAPVASPSPVDASPIPVVSPIASP